MPSRAWPDSWKAVRSRSSGESTTPRAVPSRIFSSESVKSAMAPAVVAAGGEQRGLVDQVGQIRADHARGRGGHRVQVDVGGEGHVPGVHREDLPPAALIRRRHRDPPVEAARAQQRRVEDLRPVGGGEDDDALGAGEAVHLGEDLVEGLLPLVMAADQVPPPRARPIASSSSMKMIDGATCLAWSNRSRTRLAPTPTIISTNSDAEIEKNGTSASPATARASSVLPVPGGPASSTPWGICAPSRRYRSGLRRKSTISVTSFSTSSMPATSAKVVRLRGPGVIPAGAGLAHAADSPPSAAGAASAHPPREQAAEQQCGAKPEQQLLPQRGALARRVGVHRHAVRLQLLEEVIVGEGRPLRGELLHLAGQCSPRADRPTWCRNVPWMVSPVEVTCWTLFAFSWARKNVYGHRRARRRAKQRRRQEPVEDQQTQQNPPEPRPAAGGRLWSCSLPSGMPSTRQGGRDAAWRSRGRQREPPGSPSADEPADESAVLSGAAAPTGADGRAVLVASCREASAWLLCSIVVSSSSRQPSARSDQFCNQLSVMIAVVVKPVRDGQLARRTAIRAKMNRGRFVSS